MDIIITAGGTTEFIDPVRKVTNASTGKLACEIYKALCLYIEKNNMENIRIHYVVATGSVLPKTKGHTNFHFVTNTQSVEETISLLMVKYQIDIMIHLMAISDFNVEKVQTNEQLATDIAKALMENKIQVLESINQQSVEPKKQLIDIIKKVINNDSNNVLNKSVKISSKDPINVHFGKTTKIISIVKKEQPSVRLIGFKLLNCVTEEELIQVASKLGAKNQCEFVVANDLGDIIGDKHKAIFVKDNKVLDQATTKTEIGTKLVKRLFAGY